MHHIHAGHAPQYLAHSMRLIAESSCQLGLQSADTADYIQPRIRIIFGQRCFRHSGSVAWNYLPYSNEFSTHINKKIRYLKTNLHRLTRWHFSAPGHSVSRVLTVLFVFAFVWRHAALKSWLLVWGCSWALTIVDLWWPSTVYVAIVCICECYSACGQAAISIPCLWPV